MSGSHEPLWVLFDTVTTGHHVGFVTGLTQAFADRVRTVAATSFRPPESAEWLPTTTHARRDLVRNRRQMRRAASAAKHLGATGFVDLFYDRNVWFTPPLRDFPARVHVLHHTTQYLKETRPFSAMSGEILRRRTRRLTGDGSYLLVHTQRAAQIMADLVPDGQMAFAGYPIAVPETFERQPDPQRFTILFVGAARPEKGLDILAEAIAISQTDARLVIMGRQPPGTKERLETRFADLDIQWFDAFVPTDQLAEAYAKCSLAALPYSASFGAHGGPSSVLLETLSRGVPILTTSALAEQLPPDYRGAVVTQPDAADALAGGLTEAIGALPHLEKNAAHGAAFVQEHHTFERYVDTILALPSRSWR